MGILKTIIGLNLIKGVSVSRGVSKSKQRTKSIKKDLFLISQFVVELTTLIATLIVGIYKLASKVIKFIASKFCKDNAVVSEQIQDSNVIDFNTYKKKKVI